MVDALARLDAIATEVMNTFEIKNPPVPVETMLQHPREGMWKEVNVSQLTGSFLSFKDQYSPRMSMARLLARHILNSDWGKARDLPELITEEETLRTFARMLIMPTIFLKEISTNSRNPVAMSMQFEVPEEDAQQRISDLGSGI